MHPDLIAALRAGWPIVHLVTVSLPGHTIRWTDAGFVRWGGQTWRARDSVYGTLEGISDITDGIDDDAEPVTISIIPPDLTALGALASVDAQGGWVVIHLGAVHPDTGELVTPYQIYVGELDQPRLVPGKTRVLEYDVITGDARGLEPNEEQRQSNAFRQLVWPGERGDEYATDGTKIVYWREDEPRNAIGILQGRGGNRQDNKAIEFSYEPNAPLVFPFGRVAVSGSLRYRVGYGPTNRYQSVVATVGASGPVKGLVQVSFDDEVTEFDRDKRAINGSHRGEMWFSFLPGEQPSTNLTSPTGPNAYESHAPGWLAPHRLSGRPCFMWTGKENSKKSEYQGGLPKPLLTLDGLFGYDPLLDSTRGGVGTCRLDNPTTWPWIEEGARAALNWAIGRWEGAAPSGRYGVPYQSWAVGGIGAPIQTIDVSAFTVAAQVADGNGWRMAGAPRSDEDKIDVLERMLKASGAVRSRRCGMLSCVSFGAPVASVLTATAADTVAVPKVNLGPSRLDRRNTGIPSFLSAQHNWEVVPIAAVTDPDWFAEDGGRQTDGYEYVYVPAAQQAAQLCYLEMAHERERVESETDFQPWMMQLEPGAAFDWDEPEYGLTDIKVRVRKRVWSPKKCTVRLLFREETDAKYAKAFAQTGSPPPAFAPPLKPVVDIPATRPIWSSHPFPITGEVDAIKVLAHDAMMPWGEVVQIAAATIAELDSSLIYGVFWRLMVPAEGEPPLPPLEEGEPPLGEIEVEAYPATGHMGVGGWVFLGWQSPSDALGVFPPLPVAPPGHGGTGETPGLPIAGGVTPGVVDDILGRLDGEIGSAVAEAEARQAQALADAKALLEAADATTNAALAGLSSALDHLSLEDLDGFLAYSGAIQTALDGKATNGTVEALTTRVNSNEGSLAAQNGRLNTVETDLAGKAAATDLANLTTRVTSAEGVNAAQNTRLNTVESDVAGKAAATEVNTLKAEVQTARNGSASLHAQLTGMRQTSSDLQSGKANASDLTALTTRVTSAEGVNAAQNTRLNTVESDVAGKASATSVTNLTTTVNARPKTYVGSNAPGEPQPPGPRVVGDIWIMPNLGNRSFAWTGTSWVEISDARVAQTAGQVITLESTVGGHQSAITDLQTGKANASDYAVLSARVGATESTITSVQTVAADAQGKASAVVGLLMDVNGKVAGTRSINTGDNSLFEILSDAFRVLSADGSTEFTNGIWYTVNAGIRTSWGKVHGVSGQGIVWWTGSNSVVRGQESKANAYVFVSMNTTGGPRFGGSDVPGGVIIPKVSASSALQQACVFDNVLSDGVWDFQISAVHNPGWISGAPNGTWAVYEQAKGAAGPVGILLASGTVKNNADYEPTTFNFGGGGSDTVRETGDRQLRVIVSGISVTRLIFRVTYSSATGGGGGTGGGTGSSVGLSDAMPKALGSAAPGTSGQAARSDHIHAHGDQAGGSLHAVATPTTAGFQSAADKSKLDGIAAGATANSTDTYLRNRGNHTGTQAWSTITGAPAITAETTTDSGVAGQVVKTTSTGNIVAAGLFRTQNENVYFGPTGGRYISSIGRSDFYVSLAMSGPGFNPTSDPDLKDNIVPVSDDLAALIQILGIGQIEYDRVQDSVHALGFNAKALRDANPLWVVGGTALDPEGPVEELNNAVVDEDGVTLRRALAVDPLAMLSSAYAAIRQLANDIGYLESRHAAALARIEALEALISNPS